MVVMREWPKIYVRDFGPFREARIELAPLVALIGRNSLGKSMLLYLLWALENTMPDLPWLASQVAEAGGPDIASDIVASLEKGGEGLEERVRELMVLNLRGLAPAWARALEDQLERLYGVSLSELVRVNAASSEIRIEGREAVMMIRIKGDELDVEWLKPGPEAIVEHINVRSIGSWLTLEYEGRSTNEYIRSVIDVELAMVKLLNVVIGQLFETMLGSTGGETALLVDGRAGIIRTLLETHPGHLYIAREALAADVDFISTTQRLIEDLARRKVELDAPPLRLLLEELGCHLELERKPGIPRLHVRPWLGPRLPIDRAPSGIREAISPLLSLLSRDFSIIYIEEPEAHLHPRAIRHLARLIAYAINKHGKLVRLTTHSDTFICQLNNLIALSSTPEVAEERGYTREETLRPELVRAYLLERGDEHVDVIELPVTEEGFDESAFEEVARELAEERGEALGVLYAREKAGGKAGGSQ
ncbi:MAG: hypothetical protein DRN06_07485 [Thermoprotei archaeon]|nr:MAG: hypothetical protein DRN06_07485 [Thermoprotei archaeon]